MFQSRKKILRIRTLDSSNPTITLDFCIFFSINVVSGSVIMQNDLGENMIIDNNIRVLSAPYLNLSGYDRITFTATPGSLAYLVYVE
ncbi:MAG: hypothetical protein NC918_06110 [Candidatus Omnitrophica bacterium]|nr:hypothetical protein [Candidatus Omnitrophota bacterium]